MALARHDDEGEKFIQYQVGNYGLKNYAQLEEYPASQVQFHDGTSQDHAFNLFRETFRKFPNNDGPERYPHKMRRFDFEVIQDLHHFVADHLEAVLPDFFVNGTFGFSVPPQIDQQKVIMIPQCPDLPKPDGTAAAGTVDEGYPGGVYVFLICFEVEHLV